IVHSAQSVNTRKANSCFHFIFIMTVYHVRICSSNRIMPTLWKFLDRSTTKAAPSDFIIKNGKFAMEISSGQKLIQTQRASAGKSFQSNPFGILRLKYKKTPFNSRWKPSFGISPRQEDHFEIFEHIRGFNVTIVTSTNTQDKTLQP
ncbi:hypothetical protein RJ639_015327, partial [Escallonia herrerae]